MCHFERVAAARKRQRRERMREVGRRAAVVALVAASGATGLGAAFLPDGPMSAGAVEPTPISLRLLPEPPPHPVTLAATPAPWTQPLSFHCYSSGDGVTYCVVTSAK